ncbi:gastric triacylglycerol lipase isoform X2 [Nilaparvata lugens]|uniref:gastric triacylglycerol lipase isoform X2 n=1 Tax=Nilaparvata lugens TaxID=108931 RepID=UPI00193D758C|nr:gastric triacylglycerol lipase isoform X2 [Nilaparvata lugens]
MLGMWKSQATKLFVISILLLDLPRINGSGRSDDYIGEDSAETPPLSKDVRGKKKMFGIFRNRSNKQKEPFVMERTDELIRKAGYDAESYLVDVPIGRNIIVEERQGQKLWSKKKGKYTMTTFKIEIFRIIHPGRDRLRNLPVVLLMHGATGSSSDYVFAGKDDSLGFYLADSGYDVWLGNLRGNFYGGLNTYKNVSAFWDFSFHEMGLYDLPTEIDFILSATGRSKLFYVGFSMGTTSSYVLLSSKTIYNDKIERMVSLAPVVYLSWTKTSNFLEKLALWNHKFYDTILKLAHVRSYWRSPLWGYKRPKCHKKWLRPICDLGIQLMSSNDVTLCNQELREKFLKIVPVGTSWKAVMHYSTLATSEHHFSHSAIDVPTPGRLLYMVCIH